MNYQLLKDIMGSKIPSEIVYYTSTFLNIMDRKGLGFHFQKQMKKYTHNRIKNICIHPGLSPYYFQYKKQGSFRFVRQTTFNHSHDDFYIPQNCIYNEYYFRRSNFKMKYMLEITTSYSPHRSIIYKEIRMRIIPNYKDKNITPDLNLDDLCTGFSYTPYFLEFLQKDLEYELNEKFEDNTIMLRQMTELALKIENRIGGFLIKK
jgi:hypothetical protein